MWYWKQKIQLAQVAFEFTISGSSFLPILANTDASNWMNIHLWHVFIYFSGLPDTIVALFRAWNASLLKRGKKDGLGKGVYQQRTSTLTTDLSVLVPLAIAVCVFRGVLGVFAGFPCAYSMCEMYGCVDNVWCLVHIGKCISGIFPCWEIPYCWVGMLNERYLCLSKGFCEYL